MRELKFHEQKLLKKVNFLQWKSDQNVREIQILRRYHVQNRDDYVKYSKVAGQVRRGRGRAWHEVRRAADTAAGLAGPLTLRLLRAGGRLRSWPRS